MIKFLKDKNSKEKGITLVALAITIVVLITLAEISIPMVTGNNGLILQAITARNNTDKNQITDRAKAALLRAVSDDKNLDDKGYVSYSAVNNELIKEGFDVNISELPAIVYIKNIPFLIEEDGIIEEASEDDIKVINNTNIMKQDLKNINSELIVNYGYLTGIEPETTVQNLSLPSGYSIYDANGGNLIANDQYVGTGMIVKKDGNKMATVVIYGDVESTNDGSALWDIQGNGIFTTGDTLYIQKFIRTSFNIEFKPYQKIAADAIHNYLIEDEDWKTIVKIVTGFQNVKVDQKVPARKADRYKIKLTE